MRDSHVRDGGHFPLRRVNVGPFFELAVPSQLVFFELAVPSQLVFFELAVPSQLGFFQLRLFPLFFLGFVCKKKS